MFQHPAQPSQIRVLRNPAHLQFSQIIQPSEPFVNGNSPSPSAAGQTPVSPVQGQQQQLTALAEKITQTAPRSLVQVKAYEMVHEGEFRYIRTGPTFSVLDSVDLFNPFILPARARLPNSSIRFNIREIQDFTVIRSGGGRKPPFGEKKKILLDPDQPVQLQLITFVVKTAAHLKTLAQIVYDVDTCGICFEGEYVGRTGNVTWILLSAKKTLVPIDIVSLTQEAPNLWETLRKAVFENKKLTKIFHDCRSASDYLFHKHGIKMVNVFDTQVADALIQMNSNGLSPGELRTLADALTLYNARIPNEEIDYLRKFDQCDFKKNNPWMSRPIPEPQYLKYAALKVKHLVPLRDNTIKKMLEKFTKGVACQLEVFNQSDASLHHPVSMSADLEAILND